MTLQTVFRLVKKYHSLGVKLLSQSTFKELPSPTFSITVPIALINITETVWPRLSKGSSFFLVYVDLIAILSPASINFTESIWLASGLISQIPVSTNREVWSTPS